MSKFKRMKNLEKKMSAVQALLEHINDFGGVESMYAGAARAQVEIMSAMSGLASDYAIIVRMVQDYIMMLDELKKMEREVRDEEQA